MAGCWLPGWSTSPPAALPCLRRRRGKTPEGAIPLQCRSFGCGERALSLDCGVRSPRVESDQSKRIPIDERLSPVVLPTRLLNDLYLHARESHPEECCGLLTGSGPDSYLESHRCRNEMTKHHQNDPVAHPRDGTQAFHMSEVDYLDVVRCAAGAGRFVTGIYHSHVDAEVYFSELDQDFASQPLFPFPGAVHFVVSIVDREIKGVGAFRWLHGEERFEGRLVRAEAR